MPMKLRELMDKIVKPNGLWTQRAAEARLGIPQWKLSNFKNAGDDSEYEKGWQDFLRLLAFCRRAGIDPARDLESPTATEVILDVEGNGEKTSGDVSRGKGSPKKKGPGTLSSRGAQSGAGVVKG